MPELKKGDVVLKNYTIERLLGKGAFGEVFLARHANLNVLRALKVLRKDAPGMGSTIYTSGQDRFFLEAQLGARLKSEYVVDVHDFQQEDDNLILVMEYASGGSLAEKIERSQEKEVPIPLDEVLKIAADISAGMAALHQKDIVHRDLKPSNILFDQQGHAKVADLGLAQVPGATTSRSLLGSSSGGEAARHPGTPAYMSPEQESRYQYLTLASDVYSLGLIFFELLTGRSYKTRPGTRVKSQRADVPDWLDSLVARMLEKDPEKRFQDAREVLGEIQKGMGAQQRVLEEKAQQEHLRLEKEKQEKADRERAEAEKINAGPVLIPGGDNTGPQPGNRGEDQSGSAGRQKGSKRNLLIGIIGGIFLVGLLAVVLTGGWLAGRMAAPIPTQAPVQIATQAPTSIPVDSPTNVPAIPTGVPAPTDIVPATAVDFAPGKEIKIAVLAPLSGSVPSFGVSTREGALMAMDEWNARGGVLGKKIVAVVEDSQCMPDPAVTAANKVINQDKVHYIVGEVCSKASIPVSVIANAKGVLQVSSTSTNTAVTVDANGKTKDFIFRACFIDSFQGQVAARFAVNTLKFKTAFVLEDPSSDYEKGLAEAFKTSFTGLGGQLVGNENYNGASDKDFSAILAKVGKANPDLIYLPDYYDVAGMVAKQARASGIKAPFMGGDGWDSTDLDFTALDGSYYTNHFAVDSTDAAVVTFVKGYSAKYQDDNHNPKIPDALAALAYDATNLIIQSIANAGVDDAARVKVAMAAIQFNGVSGQLSFDAQHNPVKSAVVLQVKNKKVSYFTTVKPVASGNAANPTHALGIGSTRISEKDGMKLMYVPEGNFKMGSDTGESYEKPAHTVYLDAFWMDQTEVTNSMYAKCVNAGNCHAPWDIISTTRSTYYGNSQFADYPVMYVDWNQANTYCQWAGRQLPTEAQWEKAARGTDGRTYPWGEGIDRQKAQYLGPDTAKVGSFPKGASPYGVLDMAGNVWQWAADWYSETYYGSSPDHNPAGPDSGQFRVLRGGSWGDNPNIVRTSNRDKDVPNDKGNNKGIRCSINASSQN